MPISQSYLIPVAFTHGFNYHHAVGNYAMLLKWLPQQVACNVPPYASHQIGVAGIGVFKNLLLIHKVLYQQIERSMKFGFIQPHYQGLLSPHPRGSEERKTLVEAGHVSPKK